MNFSNLEDKNLVWKCMKDGCRNANVVVTQDSRARRDGAGIAQKPRRRKMSDFHANCHHSKDPIYLSSELATNENDCKITEEKWQRFWNYICKNYVNLVLQWGKFLASPRSRV